MANKNLHAAKTAKNDEFYTQLTDIEKELMHYKKHFQDKVVFCNCDDPKESAFWRYFDGQFNRLGLKRLITTHYTAEGHSYMIDRTRQGDESPTIIKDLQGNGDFRSEECIELLKQADIVVTNPPFSLFREYVAQLMEYDKKFLIIGNPNAITYKEFFPLLKEDKVWVGFKSMGTDMLFDVSIEYAKWLVENKKEGSGYKIVNGVVKGRASAIWYTNLDITKRHEPLDLYKKYDPDEYPKYDNYDAINVDKVAEIPKDYYGVMGVPITFMDKYNPEQFEILGANVYDDIPFRIDRRYKENGYLFLKSDGVTPSGSGALRDKTSPKIPGKGKSDYSVSPDGLEIHAVYDRVFIKRKEKPNNED